MSILDGVPPKRQYTQINTDELEALKAENVRLRGAIKHNGFFLSKDYFSIPALQGFEQFIELVKTGAMYINIHVRKDSEQYHFQADALKHIEALPPKPEGESDE